MYIAGGIVCEISLRVEFRCYLRCEVRCYLFVELSLFALFHGDNSPDCPFEDEAFRSLLRMKPFVFCLDLDYHRLMTNKLLHVQRSFK